MPKVSNLDRYNPDQVRQEALPGVRTNPGSPDEAFNIGQSSRRAQAQTQNALQTIQEINDSYVKQADETLASSRFSTAQAASNKLRQDLKGMTGSAAIGAKNTIDEQWNKVQSDSLKDLTPNQRAILGPKLRAEYDSLDQSVNLHMGEEIPKYQVSVYDAQSKTAKEKAIQNYDDPRVVGEGLFVQAKSIEAKAKVLGYSPEQEAQAKIQMVSDTHVGIINAMLADNRTSDALQHFKDTQSFILPEDRKSIHAALNDQLNTENAAKKASEILQSGNPEDMVSKINSIEDSKLREETKRIVEAGLVQSNLQKNQTEAEIASKIASGDYKMADLNRDRANMDPAYYEIAKTALRQGNRNGFLGIFKGGVNDEFRKINSQFSDLLGMEPEKRTAKLRQIRSEILINKNKLTSEQFKELLLLTGNTSAETNDSAFDLIKKSNKLNNYFIGTAKYALGAIVSRGGRDWVVGEDANGKQTFTEKK